ncbi:hypothetical protein [Dyadobacter fanqingshengii]|uniref:Uncharacterized protein n=1 Tax=Dyadobacter fanqingshengii TaxID=2906443 RepID=A0A9X1PDB1_9BACT|nr:hypothetical protein [Dyadobacter fanqingshengii]MCF0041142.1 hypothetical protein [Dyadobacter fanqingshengii]MCF2505751.1 hypothetical protein [Dyadobacter fanqingshengii]USJ37132.1 hypothetical protein NFI81_04990 [Dyadobacter fanqingshengii]
MNVFHLRMLLAARRQLLRDMSEEMSQDQIDRILDQIAVLVKLIEQYEKK